MAIKNDRWIAAWRSKPDDRPFVDYDGKHKGSSSSGCRPTVTTLRVADEYKVFTNVRSSLVDPKIFAYSFVDFKGDVCMIPPNSFALARSSSASGSQATSWRLHRQKQLRPGGMHLHITRSNRCGQGDSDARDLQHHTAARQDLQP